MSQKTAAERPPRPRRRKGRRALTPITFSPPSKGTAPSKKKISVGKKAKGVAAGRDGAAHLSARLPEGEFRDIGELTFGKRDAADASLQPKSVLLGSAVSTADRVRVAEVTQPPWRKICDLLITAADGTLHTGTGWFISPRTLVTAGHCVFVFNPGTPAHGLARSVLVMPARNGETDAAHSPFGWVEVPRENLRVHERWASDGDLGFDYGAVILPAAAPPLGSQVGFFGVGHFLDQDLDESAPVLSGYPDNVPDGTQWMERNPIKEVTQTRVFYDIFTFSGQSGSPVFFRNNNRDIACAIHNFGDVTLNSGVRINPDVIAQLDAWKA
jgi:V8-like Glu-specific endopeptidase